MAKGFRQPPVRVVAAIGYSLISPTCVLVPSARLDVDGLFGPRRLITLVNYGGARMSLPCLLALAIGMLHVALEKRKPGWWMAAALCRQQCP